MTTLNVPVNVEAAAGLLLAFIVWQVIQDLVLLKTGTRPETKIEAARILLNEFTNGLSALILQYGKIFKNLPADIQSTIPQPQEFEKQLKSIAASTHKIVEDLHTITVQIEDLGKRVSKLEEHPNIRS